MQMMQDEKNVQELWDSIHGAMSILSFAHFQDPNTPQDVKDLIKARVLADMKELTSKLELGELPPRHVLAPMEFQTASTVIHRA
jgi:hypothetical protein